MNGNETVICFLVVVLFTALLVAFSSKSIRDRFPVFFRKIRGAQKIRRMIGITVEDGARIHVALGNSTLIDLTSASALTGLSTLDRIEQLTSTSDLPPMCTSGNGCLQILSQDILNQHVVDTNREEMHDPNLAQMPGVTPFAYALGTMETLDQSGAKAHLLIGNFGVEAGFICEAAANQQGYTIAGSDSLVAQSVFLALADDALIGEEVFALPAYLGARPSHQASLRAQDILRIVIIVAILGGAILQLWGIK